MNDNFDLSASDILVKCLQVLQPQKNIKILNPSQANPSQTSPSNKNMYQLPFESYFSPHQQAQNKKILQRLRRKTNKRKQSREVLIRKTDLGQNQLIFTKQQLERLQQIDQQEMYGPNYFRQGGVSKQKPSQDPDKKYFINNTQQNQHEQILKYLQWVDISDLKNNKDKKKSKILNFQKRQTSPVSINHNKRSRSPLPLLLAKHSSPFKNLKTLQLSKAKSCYPLINKNSVDKGFLNSINANDTYENRRLSQKEQLNQIIAKVNQKIEKELSNSQYIYMTEERKQALFQCQVLRRVKREIGSKFFNNLQLKYGSREKTQKTQQDQDDSEKENAQNGVRNMQPQPSNLKKNSFRSNCLSLKQKTSLNPKQKPFPETQAEKMIQKNRNRLKQQRKRVIQRIMC